VGLHAISVPSGSHALPRLSLYLERENLEGGSFIVRSLIGGFPGSLVRCQFPVVRVPCGASSLLGIVFGIPCVGFPAEGSVPCWARFTHWVLPAAVCHCCGFVS